ncbi:unnamed protein product [Lasius platythorax]|uniref:Uncharacterized protein n=1 Tax=Lasius platythorax TaxID=488582 RepID=A0AAV2NTB0_9HYME
MMEEDYVDPVGEGSLRRRGGEDEGQHRHDIRKRHWYPDDGEERTRGKVSETNFQVSLVDSSRGEPSQQDALRASSFSVTLAPISFRLPSLLLALCLSGVVTLPATGTWPLI